MPSAAAESFLRDRSGYSSTPTKGSNVEPRNRICYRDRQMLTQLLHGPEVSTMIERFTHRLCRKVHSLPIGEEWIEISDLFEFCTTHITLAVIESFCGDELTGVIDPRFAQKLWEFDTHTPILAKNLPKWLFWSSYEIRDELLNSLTAWRTWMFKIPLERDIAGMSKPMRNKLQLLDADGWSIEAIAASDLGFIWGYVDLVYSRVLELTTVLFKGHTLYDFCGLLAHI